jgi:hypothetical protein
VRCGKVGHTGRRSLVTIEKRAPVTIVRGAPPEGFSFLRIFPLRISKTVSFTVYFDSGTAFGHSRCNTNRCGSATGSMAKRTCRPRLTRCVDGPASPSARQRLPHGDAPAQTPGPSRSTRRHRSTTRRIRPVQSVTRPGGKQARCCCRKEEGDSEGNNLRKAWKKETRKTKPAAPGWLSS